MRFFILVFNPKYILVKHIEDIVKSLKNQTGHIIEAIPHMDDRDMPIYLINSEENKHINIQEIKDGEAIKSSSQV